MKKSTMQESINCLICTNWKRGVSSCVYQFKFEKIMTVKEREKDEALSVYNESVKRFEDAAEKLYELLKQKEDLENYQSVKT